MADDARRFVPVRTGFLLSTIGLGATGLKWGFWLYARAPYAAFVEFGTRRMSARLFMTRAVELHTAEMWQEIQSAVARAFTEAGLIFIG
jgi:HK97 gp10 family phage protein